MSKEVKPTIAQQITPEMETVLGRFAETENLNVSEVLGRTGVIRSQLEDADTSQGENDE